MEQENKVKIFHAVGNILKMYIKHEYVQNNTTHYQANVLICGLVWFECEFSHHELLALDKHIEIYSAKIDSLPSLNSVNHLCQKIDTNNTLPLFDLVYLFKTQNRTNLSKFYEMIINSAEYKEEEDKTFFIYNQIFLNRSELNEMWDNSKNNSNSWVFSNGNATSEFSRFDKIDKFVPNLHLIWDDIPTEYSNSSSLDELVEIILQGKKISFKKELEVFILKNLLLEFNFGREMNILNIPLFEKLSLLFQIDKTSLKSIKDVERFLLILDKMSLDTPSETFLFRYLKNKQSIIEFCSLFQEEPMEVLKRTNIPYHLIKGNIFLLKKYYENNPILSIKKEKKLYYFLAHLSKKLSHDLPLEDLRNPNRDFNEDKLYYNENGLIIETVTDSKKLLQIGIRLNNCAGNIELFDEYNNRYVFLVTSNNKEFLGTIQDGEIEQLKGYKNESPSIGLFNTVLQIMNQKKYIKIPLDHDDFPHKLYNKCCVHAIFID